MPIAIDRDGKTLKMIEESFRDEYELQAYLERSPYLLVTQSEPSVVTVQREVKLPEAGYLDLLLVDSEGVPVAVEVKLARNSESRRQVIAQAFDYVSDLTQLTVDELDDVVDGALMISLDQFSKNESGIDLRKQCGTNLRAGRIKVVVVMDEPNEGLVRIVRYINDHSDLDVRLVAISKFDGGRLLVPRVLVAGGVGALPSRREGSLKTADPNFEAAIDLYNHEAPESLRTRGRGKSYRQVRPDEWPRKIHYEFCNRQDEIGVELHLESDEVRHLGEYISTLSGMELLPQLTAEWDPRWSNKRGRLVASIGKDEPPNRTTKAMEALIARTRPEIEERLNQ